MQRASRYDKPDYICGINGGNISMKAMETGRLLLRPFRRNDLDDFYEYARNPNVGPNAGWAPHQSREESERILKTFIEGDEVLAIVWKANSKVIGSIGLHDDNIRRNTEDVKMLGYVLSEDYWGRGITTEAAKAVIAYAFEELGLAMVTVHHYDNNLRSGRVIDKCGFHYEGKLRRAVKLFNGNIHDLLCYSMTREEWLMHNQ